MKTKILKSLNKIGIFVIALLVLIGLYTKVNSTSEVNYNKPFTELTASELISAGIIKDKSETGGAFLEVATTGATSDTINNNTTADTSRTVTNTGRYKHIYLHYLQNGVSTYAKVAWDEPERLRLIFSPAANGDTGYIVQKPSGISGIGWTNVPVILPQSPTTGSGTAYVATQPQPVKKIWLTVGATAGIIAWYGRNDE